MFTQGRSLIKTLDHAGKTFNLCFFFDAEFNRLIIQFVEGEFQVAVPTVLWVSGWISIPSPSSDPKQLVQDVVAQLNIFLMKQFGSEVPVTWGDQLQFFFRKIVFVLEQGVPQAKIQD